jgi:hypothetical protein
MLDWRRCRHAFFIELATAPRLVIGDPIQSGIIELRSQSSKCNVRLGLVGVRNKPGLLGKAATSLEVSIVYPSHISWEHLPNEADAQSSLAWGLREIPPSISFQTKVNLNEPASILNALELTGYIKFGKLEALSQDVTRSVLVIMALESSNTVYLASKDPVTIGRSPRKNMSFLPFQLRVFGPDLHKSHPSETLVIVGRNWNDCTIGRKFAEFLNEEWKKNPSKWVVGFHTS